MSSGCVSPPGWEHEEGEWSLKCAHRDVNGNWARPGEVPGGEFLLGAVESAIESSATTGRAPFYANAEILEHIERWSA